MAQANHVPTAIRVPITDARPRPSKSPVRAVDAEMASSFRSILPQALRAEDVPAPLSAHLSAIAAKAELNVPGCLNIHQIKALPSGPERNWTGALRPVGDTMARGSS